MQCTFLLVSSENFDRVTAVGTDPLVTPKLYMFWLAFNGLITAAAFPDFWIYTFRIQQFRNTLFCRSYDKGKSTTYTE